MVEIVGCTDINAVWDEVRPLVEKPLKRTSAGKLYDPEDIKELIESRDMQCWLAVDEKKIIACGITQILIYPKRKVFDVLFVGGERMNEWLHAFDLLKAFARSHGCHGFRGPGRKGWARIVDTDYSVYWDIDL